MDNKEIAKNLVTGGIAFILGVAFMRTGLKYTINALEGLSSVLSKAVKED